MAASAADGRALGIDDLPPALRPEHAAGVTLAAGMTVAEAERALIDATLRHTGGDKARAAALLGIGLRTLYRKLGTRAR
jgi:transcriptional regulator of acetoin/glycerol metabolism